MQINPLVSVTICAYNTVNFIRETLESVLNQTYENIEVVIVDDGSTDGTTDILKEYENRFENIKLIIQKNQGLAVARNIAFNNCCGEWIAIIDCDDICYPTRIEEQLELSNKFPDSGFLFCSADFIDQNGKVTLKNYLSRFDLPQNLIPKVVSSRILLSQGNYIVSQSFFAKKDLILKVGKVNPKYRYACDYDYFIRLGFLTNIAYTSKALVAWRRHSNQATEIMSDIALKEVRKILKEYLFDSRLSISTRLLVIFRIIKIQTKQYRNSIMKYMKVAV